MSAKRRLRYAVYRMVQTLDEMAPEYFAQEHSDSLPEPPYVTDDDWLAVVAICLSDGLGGDLDTAIRLVAPNREPCLIAREQGFEPWELAQFIEHKTQPGTGPELGPTPTETRHKRNRGKP